MGRQIEVTQFSISEYEALKRGADLPEGPRKRAMEQLTELTKDEKFNKNLGGIDNVRRVRALRDSEDKEVKTIHLQFDLKVSEYDLKRKAAIKPQETQPTQNKDAKPPSTFPVVVMCVKSYAVQELMQVMAGVAAMNLLEETKLLDGTIRNLAKSTMETKEVLKIRGDVMRAIKDINLLESDTPEITLIKQRILTSTDIAVSLLGVHAAGFGKVGKDSILKIVNSLAPQQSKKPVNKNHYRSNRPQAKKPVVPSQVTQKLEPLPQKQP